MARAPRDAAWLEIGCGTGALTATILAECAPQSVVSIDASEDFVAHIRSATTTSAPASRWRMHGKFPSPQRQRRRRRLGFLLNFIPDRASAFAEMQRVLKPNGVLSFYVWDYPTGGVGFMDAFWKAAAELDPRAGDLDEAKRFSFCTRDGLAAMCREAGVRSLGVEPIEIETAFPRFRGALAPLYARGGACSRLLRQPGRGTASTSEGASRRGSRSGPPHPPDRAGLGHHGSAGAGAAKIVDAPSLARVCPRLPSAIPGL